MKITQHKNGNLTIDLDVNEHVQIRGASIDVTLEEAANMYALPKAMSDVDSVSITGRRRATSDYPWYREYRGN